MNPVLLLRAASVITLLYWVGHTAGMPWTPAQGPTELAVLEAMKSHRFEALGAQRTYWEFYFGFGVAISAYLLVQAVVLWQVASLAKTIGSQVRPIIVSFLVAFLVNAIVVWKYFFALPLVFAIAIAICLTLAFLTSGKERGA